MRKNEFKDWLESLGTMGSRAISDSISRCGRVAKRLGVDLDEEYKKDRGTSLFEKLDYTFVISNDSIKRMLELEKVKDLKSSLGSLRSAVNKYMEFCSVNEKFE